MNHTDPQTLALIEEGLILPDPVGVPVWRVALHYLGRLPHFVRHRVLSASPTEPASGLVPTGDARMARGW